MALSLSLGLRRHVMGSSSLKEGLQGGCLAIFSGTPPTTADHADTGTLLAIIAEDGQSWTGETRAEGAITLTGGNSGEISQVTIGGAASIFPPVAFDTSLTETAIDLARKINWNMGTPQYEAIADGASVRIVALPNTGAEPNGATVTATLVTITATYTDLAGGVAAVNGLKFAHAAAGRLSKLAEQNWSGTIFENGDAEYFRIYTSSDDTGQADFDGEYRRLQGTIGTSAADLIIPNVRLNLSRTLTIEKFNIAI